jgi:hypothetical protein
MEFYFEFLNELRESGQINMFGASRVLMESFGLDKEEAKEIFIAWTEQFREFNN